ncbi:MAG: RHS repeat-associated core domain-containing protein [Ignavibacteria bacterium]|nr:RHS repeat-associated core domain-containing protein [Ignavibacteria bacterium]
MIPFGAILRSYTTGSSANDKYKFTEKERDIETNYDYFSHRDGKPGARYYDSEVGRWLSVDPMDSERPGLSPYNYCQNNPLGRIDPTGMLDDWVEDKDGNIYWDENAKSQETTKEGETYLGEVVVVFEGSENEQLGEGDNLYGDGAHLANVTVYGPGGSEDVNTYKGYTMSSDPNKFGVVADGNFTVNRTTTPGPYGSEWALNNRGSVPAKGGYNPAYPNRKPGFLTGVFIHRSNNNGWAGTFQKKGLTHGVSQGCLLIEPNKWEKFNKQLNGVNNFQLKLKR